jgi:hypothetical protein
MQLGNAVILRNRHCSNMCRYIFRMRSPVLCWQAENQRKPEIAFPSVKEWNGSEFGRIVTNSKLPCSCRATMYFGLRGISDVRRTRAVPRLSCNMRDV